MRRLTLLLALLFLWGCEGKSACAWVLWVSPLAPGAQRPHALEKLMLDSAWESKKACETEIRERIKSAVGRGKFALTGRDGIGQAEILPSPSGSDPGILLVCLPATVDPRGKEQR